jgi:hypothetical protein
MKTRIVIMLVLVVALLPLTGSAPSLAQQLPPPTPQGIGVSTEQAQNVEWVGQIGGAALSVAVQGNYAYVGV